MRVDDDADGFFVALEVRDEHLDLTAGSLAADFVDDHGEGAGSAEDVVVAIDAGDDGELEAERGDGFGDTARLVEVDGVGASFGHGAESAAAGAEIAQHHEGGGPVTPALADVGAVSGLADGVQIQVAGQLLEIVVVIANRSAGLQPVGLGDGALGREVDLDQVRLDWVWDSGHEVLL